YHGLILPGALPPGKIPAGASISDIAFPGFGYTDPHRATESEHSDLGVRNRDMAGARTDVATEVGRVACDDQSCRRKAFAAQFDSGPFAGIYRQKTGAVVEF